MNEFKTNLMKDSIHKQIIVDGAYYCRKTFGILVELGKLVKDDHYMIRHIIGNMSDKF